ncbi:hypothetical protein AWV80_35020 [Cupriavidus sp. UYMU48A]|nr:hypothetical protein AWV80_35020 [Cupriavidus sp. UYMU48A]
MGDKQKSLTSIHSLGLLYHALIDLLTKHRTELKSRAKTAWLPTPPELDHAIALIDDMDSRGVFFRYPTENNSTKSNNRPLPIEDIERWSAEKRGALKALVFVDQKTM